MQDEHHASSGVAIRAPADQAVPVKPIVVAGGRMAGQMVQVGYRVAAPFPWHWQVPAYLITKGLGAGVLLLLAIGVLLPGGLSANAAASLAGVGILALLATTALLVGDLERPARFLRIVFRPQWKSWLTRGAFLLIGLSMVATLWFALELAGIDAREPLAVATIPLAIGTAIYTAFLFAQCEGRDLWQSATLPISLFLEAIVLGCAGASLVGLAVDLGPLAPLVRIAFVVSLASSLLVVLAGEAVVHPSEVAARAARAISHGKYAVQFWIGAVVVGHVVPLVLVLMGLAPVAALFAIVGLFAHEHAFVMAPQEIPNS